MIIQNFLIGNCRNNLSRLTETSQQIKSRSAAGWPLEIVLVPGKDEAVLTLRNGYAFHLINITNKTAGKRLSVHVYAPYGIAVIKDSVYTGPNKGQFSIINRISGKCIGM